MTPCVPCPALSRGGALLKHGTERASVEHGTNRHASLWHVRNTAWGVSAARLPLTACAPFADVQAGKSALDLALAASAFRAAAVLIGSGARSCESERGFMHLVCVISVPDRQAVFPSLSGALPTAGDYTDLTPSTLEAALSVASERILELQPSALAAALHGLQSALADATGDREGAPHQRLSAMLCGKRAHLIRLEAAASAAAFLESPANDAAATAAASADHTAAAAPPQAAPVGGTFAEGRGLIWAFAWAHVLLQCSEDAEGDAAKRSVALLCDLPTQGASLRSSRDAAALFALQAQKSGGSFRSGYWGAAGPPAAAESPTPPGFTGSARGSGAKPAALCSDDAAGPQAPQATRRSRSSSLRDDGSADGRSAKGGRVTCGVAGGAAAAEERQLAVERFAAVCCVGKWGRIVEARRAAAQAEAKAFRALETAREGARSAEAALRGLAVLRIRNRGW